MQWAVWWWELHWAISYCRLDFSVWVSLKPPRPLCDYGLWAANVVLFVAIFWNVGVIRSLLTKDLVFAAFGVVNSRYSRSDADVRISGWNDLWWLAGWCFIQLSARFVFLVFNSTSIGFVYCGIVANGTAYPWIWVPLEGTYWWVGHVQ